LDSEMGARQGRSDRSRRWGRRPGSPGHQPWERLRSPLV